MRRRLLGELGDLSSRPHDLEWDIDGSGLGRRDVLARSDRFDVRQERRRVLLDELLTVEAQPLGTPVHLFGLRPPLARKPCHLLHQGRRSRDYRCRRGSARGRRRLRRDLRKEVIQASARAPLSRRRAPACASR
ncbi:MAG: hypothetical protein AUI42_08650 [Actinobacteria bacterium 13_1_40CM_2_65_8]|nr:MAG: hypothetical protein AUH69_03420 [Actinobacteria bacterium 13_1_40CM_4_65_12]OLD49281.1 MAG: hypothetical protein AUI42_08650 [Actinobacteria bacterium 13_1_40CM_2_65_8]